MRLKELKYTSIGSIILAIIVIIVGILACTTLGIIVIHGWLFAKYFSIILLIITLLFALTIGVENKMATWRYRRNLKKG